MKHKNAFLKPGNVFDQKAKPWRERRPSCPRTHKQSRDGRHRLYRIGEDRPGRVEDQGIDRQIGQETGLSIVMLHIPDTKTLLLILLIWAIVAYLRALQFSQLGTVDDVPEALRASLKK
jgi:hypothetical protein